MKIRCDFCNRKNQFHYLTVELDGKLVTLCDDCRYGRKVKRHGKNLNSFLEEISTPFYKVAGLKPKKREIQLERYLKYKGMSWRDYRQMIDYKRAKHEGARQEFLRHTDKYGTRRGPADPSFGKETA